MVKLVTKLALDSNLLPGVALLFDKDTSYFYDRNDNYFRVAENAEKKDALLQVKGKDFNYLFSQPTKDGTIDTLIVRQNKKDFYTITDVHIPLAKLLDTSSEKALSVLFKKNDTFKGSPEADIFNGHDGKDKLFGNGGGDTLYGKKGNDRLDGGEGIDRLDGGEGIDTYIFKVAPDGASYDIIVKFRPGETIELSQKAFPDLEKGVLPDDQFFVFGEGTKDANDHIMFNRDNGYIYYDPDGNGASAPMLFAIIQPDYTKLGADDFLIT